MSRSAIAGSIWRPLRGIDAHRLRDARQQVHQAVQWLARAARAYLQPRADDGHTSLGWDDSLNGFVTHPMPGGMQLCLCVPSLTLTWGDRKDVVPLSLGGHTDGQVRQWIGEQVAKQGLDANALDAPAPYTLTLNATYDAMAFVGRACRACGLVCQRRRFARPPPRAPGGPKARRLRSALLAPPFRSRNLDLVSGARR